MRYNGTIDYFTVDKQGRLDFLWVSLDGSSPETYADVRLGNELPRILENLKRLRRMKYHYPGQTPRLGIAFVLMKRNAADLHHVVRLAFQLGAEEIMITNVLPYSEEMKEESCTPGACRCINRGNGFSNSIFPRARSAIVASISNRTWKIVSAANLPRAVGASGPRVSSDVRNRRNTVRFGDPSANEERRFWINADYHFSRVPCGVA